MAGAPKYGMQQGEMSPMNEDHQQYGWNLANDFFSQMHFLNEKVWVSIKISKLVLRGPIDNISALNPNQSK